MKLSEINSLRERYHAEHSKPVRVCPYLKISTEALDSFEPITSRFAGCGSWQSFYSVEIIGGPDNGKRVDTYPWQPEDTFEYAASVYNGNRAEFDAALGYQSRPSIASHSSGLHAVTVAYLIGKLEVLREQSMSSHLQYLWEKADHS